MSTIKTEKKIQAWKHTTDFYTRNHLRSIELRQNKRVNKFAGKSTCIRFEKHVHIEVVATANIPIFGKFISIEKISYFTFSNNNDVVLSNGALPNSIFVFDDVACDQQDAIREYFAMGRHADVNCFYLCQTYARIPKHLIRDNVNLLILLKQDGTNLKYVYIDHVNTDMSYMSYMRISANCVVAVGMDL